MEKGIKLKRIVTEKSHNMCMTWSKRTKISSCVSSLLNFWKTIYILWWWIWCLNEILRMRMTQLSWSIMSNKQSYCKIGFFVLELCSLRPPIPMLSGSHAYSQTETSVPRNSKLKRAGWKACPTSRSKSLESSALGISDGQTPKPTPSQVHTLINTQLKETREEYLRQFSMTLVTLPQLL